MDDELAGGVSTDRTAVVVDALDEVATADATLSRDCDRDGEVFNREPTDPEGADSRGAGDSGDCTGVWIDGVDGIVSTVTFGGAVADARSKFAPNIA